MRTAVEVLDVHKLRNILDKAPKHADEALKDDLHAIVYADNERAARAAYKRFVDRWSKQCKAAVESLEEAGPLCQEEMRCARPTSSSA